MRSAARVRSARSSRRHRTPRHVRRSGSYGRGMVRHFVPGSRSLVFARDLMTVAGKTGRVRGAAQAGDRETGVLRERALAAMERAYAPYSKFHVGAALV